MIRYVISPITIPSLIRLPGEWPFAHLPEGCIASWRRGVSVASPLDRWRWEQPR